MKHTQLTAQVVELHSEPTAGHHLTEDDFVKNMWVTVNQPNFAQEVIPSDVPSRYISITPTMSVTTDTQFTTHPSVHVYIYIGGKAWQDDL